MARALGEKEERLVAPVLWHGGKPEPEIAAVGPAQQTRG